MHIYMQIHVRINLNNYDNDYNNTIYITSNNTP